MPYFFIIHFLLFCLYIFSLPAAGAEETSQTPVPPEKSPVNADFKSYAAGVGLQTPEGLPLEFYWNLTGRWTLRGFVGLPLPVNVTVKQESEQLSVKPRIQVSAPEQTVKVKTLYGPHLGLEGIYFLTDHDFFIFSGLSYRRIVARAEESTQLYVCLVLSNVDCGENNAAFVSKKDLVVNAHYDSYGILGRAGMGWWRPWGDHAYMSAMLGLSKAIINKKSINIDATLDGGSGLSETSDINQTIDAMIASKEAQLENKATSTSARLEKLPLPILAFTVGWLF